MKVVVLALALVSVSFAAPQPRKIFHEHVDDFLVLIFEEAADELARINDEYIQYDEFWTAIEYISSKGFRDLIVEMESLPEFNAVVEFLENDNIDITYYIDLTHEMFDSLVNITKPADLISGPGFDSYISAVTAAFPKAKLSALFDEKMANDEEFRVAVENLRSSEWHDVFSALWENELFQAELQIFNDNGINTDLLYEEMLAIFGQNIFI